jgi:spermidine synthase
MSVTSLFLPEIVEEVNSSINGKIQVVRSGSRYKLIVGGLIQSGGVLREIWEKALKQVASHSFKVSRVLMLGLGGATAASVIVKLWPQAEIVGVEIDPVMIRLGKKYFDLGKLDQLTIVQANAFLWVKNHPDKFDLILVDMYLGELIPEQSEQLVFLQDLQSISTTPGKVIFNRLFYNQHQETARKFVEKVSKIFSGPALVRCWSNLLVVGHVDSTV